MENSSSPECEYCHGAHWVHPMRDGQVDYSSVIPCRCVKTEVERRNKENLLRSCRFPPYADAMTLNNFKVYAPVKTAYESAKKMAENPGQLTWLGFIGGNGIGKTHLAIAVCKAWVVAGIPSRYALTSLLLDELREGFRRDGDFSYERQFKSYCTVPLLLLDDCGIQSSTPWVQEKLDTLVDYRLMNNLSLIVTSNLSLDEMSPRIRSRLMRHPQGHIVAIMAEDFCLRKGR